MIEMSEVDRTTFGYRKVFGLLKKEQFLAITDEHFIRHVVPDNRPPFEKGLALVLVVKGSKDDIDSNKPETWLGSNAS